MDKLLQYWKMVQQFMNVDGGLYVDAMCVVIIVRLLAVLFHFPPLTNAEAGLWGVTVTAFSGHRIAKILKGDSENDN